MVLYASWYYTGSYAYETTFSGSRQIGYDSAITFSADLKLKKYTSLDGKLTYDSYINFSIFTKYIEDDSAAAFTKIDSIDSISLQKVLCPNTSEFVLD